MSTFINIVDSDQILFFVCVFFCTATLFKGGIYISWQHLYQIGKPADINKPASY